MRSFMLLLGMGYAVLSAAGCRAHPGTPLTTAASQNDADGLRRLLAAGMTPDEGGDVWTGLIWAARENAVAAMTVLLDAGADVNMRDRNNRWTPLLHAIHRQNTEAALLLLDRGADPNLPSPDGVTPLIMAADSPRPIIVRALLARGANPRAEGPG